MTNGRTDRRAVIGIVGSGLVVIAAILIIVFVAVIPLPEFEELSPGEASGRIAFISEVGDCVAVADLQLDTRTELTCEYSFPEGLDWSRDGIEVELFEGQSGATRITLDPETGSELSYEAVDFGESATPRDPDTSFVRRGRDADVSIIGPDGDIVLTLGGPETYSIDAVTTNAAETWIAFVDSLGRLAVFEIGAEPVYLVAEDVRSFPTPVWEP